MGAKEFRAEHCKDYTAANWCESYGRIVQKCNGTDANGKAFPEINCDMELPVMLQLWDKAFENLRLKINGFVPMPQEKEKDEEEKDDGQHINVEMDMCYLTLPCQHYVEIGKKRVLMDARKIRALLEKRNLPVPAHFAERM